MTYHNYVEDKDNIEKSDMVTTLSLRANHHILRKDQKFKKAALKGMPEVIDIIYCIRFHMEGMWKLHNHFSKSHSDLADKTRSVLLHAIQRLKKESDNSSFVFHAIAALSETEHKEKVPLLLEWDDARRAALKKIGNLNNLHKRYVTGKIQKA